VNNECREQADRRVRVTALKPLALEAELRIAAPKRVEPQHAAGPACPRLRMKASARSSSLAREYSARCRRAVSLGDTTGGAGGRDPLEGVAIARQRLGRPPAAGSMLVLPPKERNMES
jgi:hypothetical protein